MRSSLALLLLLAACADGTIYDAAEMSGPPGSGFAESDGGGVPPPGTGPTSPPATPSTDGWCGVDAILASSCRGCHGSVPLSGVPLSLVTHEDLTAPSPADPSATVAERALARIQLDASPMPPAPYARVPAPSVAIFSDWIAGGMPAADCSALPPPTEMPAVPDPYDTPLTCTSGMMVSGGGESPLMEPGGACISCHTREREGPSLAIGGTVYPTAHEPDRCATLAATGATVEITDAMGTVTRIPVNERGNFLVETWAATIVMPYTARVLFEGRSRAMTTPQTDGDCNGCHTVDGAMMAPGRIMLP